MPRRSTAALTADEEFELKVLTLVYIRLVDSGSEFYLGYKIKAASPFDDIVCKYRGDTRQPWNSALLQLKHRIDNTESEFAHPILENDFDLVKITEPCFKLPSCEPLSEDLSGHQFVIFTNARLEDGVGKKSEENKIFFDTGGEVVTLDETAQFYQQLCEWSDFKGILLQLRDEARGTGDVEFKAKVQEIFSGSLKFKSRQVAQVSANIDTVEKLESTLTKIGRVPEKTSVKEFLNKVQLYTKQAEGVHLDNLIKRHLERMWKFTNSADTDVMFLDLIEEMRQWTESRTEYLTASSHIWRDLIKKHIETLSANKTKKTGINFAEESLSQLNRAIPWKKGGILHVVVKSKTITSLIKTMQILTTFGKEENFIGIDLATLLQREHEIMALWSSRWCRALVVECDTELGPRDAARLGDKIIEVLEGKMAAKLFVFIARQDHGLTETLDNLTSYKVFRDNCKGLDLLASAQEDLLKSEIKYQGHQISLEGLVGQDKKFLTRVNGEAISQLLRGDTLCGKVLEPADKNFIPRQLKTTDDVSKPCNSVLDCTEKVVLVVAEPGMGKSALFNHLAISTKTKDPTTWIVQLKLGYCKEHLARMDLENFGSNAAQRLLRDIAVCSENSLEVALFSVLDRNLVVLVDGVEEVCVQYEKQVMQLLRSLANLHVRHLWVAARKALQKNLECLLEITAHYLMDFTSNELSTFLVKTWSSQFPKLPVEKINSFVELLKDSQETKATFQNLPSQGPLTASLVAEFLSQYLRQFSELDIGVTKPELPAEISLEKTDLYFQFVQNESLKSQTFAAIDGREKLFIEIHRLAALKSLLSQKDFSALHVQEKSAHEMHLEEFLVEVKIGREKTCIIDNVSSEGTPHFAHHVFVEYFAASWLSENFKNNQKLVERITFSPSFASTCHMFNRILARGHRLHTAVLNSELLEVERMLKDNGSSQKWYSKSKDAGGRTPVHLTVLLGSTKENLDILRLLVGHKEWIDISDNVLGWRPLHYADKANAWTVAGMLLSKGGSEGDLVAINLIKQPTRQNFIAFVKQSSTAVPKADLMLAAARDAGLSFVRFLVEERLGDVNCRGPRGESMMHMAAEGGDVTLIEYLCDKGLSLDAEDSECVTPLSYAALQGHTDAVKFFLGSRRVYQRRTQSPAVSAERKAENKSVSSAPSRPCLQVSKDTLQMDDDSQNDKKSTAVDEAACPGDRAAVAVQPPKDFFRRLLANIERRKEAVNKEFDPEKPEKIFSKLPEISSHFEETLWKDEKPRSYQDHEKALKADSDSQISFRKTPGVAYGVDFEVQVLTLVYLRLLDAGLEFFLGTQVAACGKFDDIVVKYRADSQQPWKTALFHLKYKQKAHLITSSLLSLHGDLSLVKYCNSIGRLQSSQEVDMEFLGDFSGRQFIVFTNARFLDNPTLKGEANPLFDTGGEAVFFPPESQIFQQLCEWVDLKLVVHQLKEQIQGRSDEFVAAKIKETFSEWSKFENNEVNKVIQSLLKNPSENTIERTLQSLQEVRDKEFYAECLSKLQLYTGQANVKDLGKMISQCVADTLKLTDHSESARLAHELGEKVRAWWKKSTKYLTQHSDIWLDLVTSHINKLSVKKLVERSEYNFQFTDAAIDGLHRKIPWTNGGILHVIVESETTASSMKVVAALTRFGDKENILHVDLATLLNKQDKILGAWSSRWCRTLVVECDTKLGPRDAARLADKIIEVLEGKMAGKLFVFIARQHHDLTETLDPKSFKCQRNICKWDDLRHATMRHRAAVKDKAALEGISGPSIDFEDWDHFKLLRYETHQDHYETINRKRQKVRNVVASRSEKSLDTVTRLEATYPIEPLVDKRSHGKEAALIQACNDGNMEVVMLLLENGASVEVWDNSGNSPLYVAAQQGHEEVVAFLLQHVEDKNTRNRNGRTALFQACYDGNMEVVKLLVESGASTSVCDHDGNSPLYVAAQQGQEEVVKLLLENGASTAVWDNGGYSPLYVAAQQGHEEVVKLLLENGASTAVWDNGGYSPLYVAAQQGHEEVVKLLLESGASVEVWDNDGNSPLYVAAQQGHEEVVAFLLQHVEDKNTRNRNGRTALFQACYDGNMEIVKLLVESGASTSVCDHDGKSPLHVAAQQGHKEVVAFLLQHVEDKNTRNRNGRTALFQACYDGNMEIVKLLVESGASTSVCDHDGNSPLYVAAQRGHDEVVKLLVENGASTSVCDKYGKSPLYVAAERGHKEVVAFLLQHDEDKNTHNHHGRTALLQACYDGNMEVVKLLVENGASTSVCDNDGKSPLYVAAQQGHKEVVVFLLQHVMDKNTRNLIGRTALLQACYNGNMEVVKLLVESGASTSVCDHDGKSPLHVAAQQGHKEVVAFLLQHVEDKNTRNRNGRTALFQACYDGNMEVVKLLVESGASTSVCDHDGNSPLYVAAQRGHEEVVKLLVENGASTSVCDHDGNSPLYVAAQQGHKEVVAFLLQHVKDKNTRNRNGRTALIQACYRGQMEVVKLLVENGASTSVCDHDGNSPLYVAAQQGHKEVVAFLLQHVKDKNTRNRNGRTALIQACYRGQMEVVRMLVENGASTSVCDNDGNLPLHAAAERGHEAVVALLLHYVKDLSAVNKIGETASSLALRHGHLKVMRLLSDKIAS